MKKLISQLLGMLVVCFATTSCETNIENSRVPQYTILEFVIADKNGELVNIAETAEENDLRVVKDRQTIRVEPTSDTRTTVPPLPVYRQPERLGMPIFEFSNNGYTLSYGMIDVVIDGNRSEQFKVIYGDNYWDVTYSIDYKDWVMTATVTVNGEEVSRELRPIPTDNGDSYEVAAFPLHIYAEE